MAKIIYRKGMEGQNKLSCIEGIEIDLLNGQQALIFPKYSKEPLLRGEQIDKWNARALSEIEALKVEDTISETAALFDLGSPAANWVLLFVTKDRSGSPARLYLRRLVMFPYLLERRMVRDRRLRLCRQQRLELQRLGRRLPGYPYDTL